MLWRAWVHLRRRDVGFGLRWFSGTATEAQVRARDLVRSLRERGHVSESLLDVSLRRALSDGDSHAASVLVSSVVRLADQSVEAGHLSVFACLSHLDAVLYSCARCDDINGLHRVLSGLHQSSVAAEVEVGALRASIACAFRVQKGVGGVGSGDGVGGGLGLGPVAEEVVLASCALGRRGKRPANVFGFALAERARRWGDSAGAEWVSALRAAGALDELAARSLAVAAVRRVLPRTAVSLGLAVMEQGVEVSPLTDPLADVWSRVCARARERRGDGVFAELLGDVDPVRVEKKETAGGPLTLLQSQKEAIGRHTYLPHSPLMETASAAVAPDRRGKERWGVGAMRAFGGHETIADLVLLALTNAHQVLIRQSSSNGLTLPKYERAARKAWEERSASFLHALERDFAKLKRAALHSSSPAQAIRRALVANPTLHSLPRAPWFEARSSDEVLEEDRRAEASFSETQSILEEESRSETSNLMLLQGAVAMLHYAIASHPILASTPTPIPLPTVPPRERLLNLPTNKLPCGFPTTASTSSSPSSLDSPTASWLPEVEEVVERAERVAAAAAEHEIAAQAIHLDCTPWASRSPVLPEVVRQVVEAMLETRGEEGVRWAVWAVRRLLPLAQFDAATRSRLSPPPLSAATLEWLLRRISNLSHPQDRVHYTLQVIECFWPTHTTFAPSLLDARRFHTGLLVQQRTLWGQGVLALLDSIPEHRLLDTIARRIRRSAPSTPPLPSPLRAVPHFAVAARTLLLNTTSPTSSDSITSHELAETLFKVADQRKSRLLLPFSELVDSFRHTVGESSTTPRPGFTHVLFDAMHEEEALMALFHAALHSGDPPDVVSVNLATSLSPPTTSSTEALDSLHSTISLYHAASKPLSLALDAPRSVPLRVASMINPHVGDGDEVGGWGGGEEDDEVDEERLLEVVSLMRHLRHVVAIAVRSGIQQEVARSVEAMVVDGRMGCNVKGHEDRVRWVEEEVRKTTDGAKEAMEAVEPALLRFLSAWRALGGMEFKDSDLRVNPSNSSSFLRALGLPTQGIESEDEGEGEGDDGKEGWKREVPRRSHWVDVFNQTISRMLPSFPTIAVAGIESMASLGLVPDMATVRLLFTHIYPALVEEARREKRGEGSEHFGLTPSALESLTTSPPTPLPSDPITLLPAPLPPAETTARLLHALLDAGANEDGVRDALGSGIAYLQRNSDTMAALSLVAACDAERVDARLGIGHCTPPSSAPITSSLFASTKIIDLRSTHRLHTASLIRQHLHQAREEAKTPSQNHETTSVMFLTGDPAISSAVRTLAAQLTRPSLRPDAIYPFAVLFSTETISKWQENGGQVYTSNARLRKILDPKKKAAK